MRDLVSRRPGAVPLATLAGAAGMPAALALATFLAATPWLHAYSVSGTLGLLVAASVASTAIAVLCAGVWRQGVPVSYVCSLAGLVALLFAGAGPHPSAVWHGLVDGPNWLLTETLPLGGGRAVLAAPVVLTWLCGAITTEVETRVRPSRRGVAGAGLAVPVVAFVVAYAMSAASPGRNTLDGALLFVTLALVAVGRHLLATGARPVGAPATGEPDARPSTWRPGLAGVVVAVMVTAVLAAVVPALPTMSQKPASLNRPAPLTTGVVVDPVGAMANLRDGDPRAPAHEVLEVTTNRPSTGYLAMAVLDRYDGAVWSFDTTFQPTGGRVPTATSSPGTGSTAVANQDVVQSYRVSPGLPVPLLPAMYRPVQVTGTSVVADAATGMLLPARAAGGVLSYAVVSRVPVETLAKLPVADGIGRAAGAPLPAGGTVSAADLSLPPRTSQVMATALRFLSGVTDSRPSPTVAFLQSAMDALHSRERRVEPNAPTVRVPSGATPTTTPQSRAFATRIGGTSLSEVINAVTVNRSATPEQFATFFAMVARYLGVPARLVSGFRLSTGSGGTTVAAGAHQVTNRQAWAWVEIPLAGVGWVVADPTPDAVAGSSAPPPEQVQGSATTLPPRQANAVPRSQITGGHAVAKPARVTIPRSHPTPIWLIAVLVLIGLLVLAVLAGPGLAAVRRHLRRRVRSAAEPRALAVGAWLELLDGLDRAGYEPARGTTSSEVAEEAGRHFGPDVVAPVRQVGALADRAVFSSRPPDASEAQGSWSSQRDVRRAIHRGLDRRQRAKALLSVGSSPRQPGG
ncbi:MAG: DUF4129 domain-containing transglutaminase family protein [Acidimicrobiales bacterium]